MTEESVGTFGWEMRRWLFYSSNHSFIHSFIRYIGNADSESVY